jgi:phage baseplate assembly protein W
MTRHDYAFPFRIDPVSGQAAQSPYGTHVDQMIRQVLLTSPGERADLPEFGCGLRQLIFAPNSDALQATTELIVRKSLDRWLAGQIQVQRVGVASGAGGDESQIVVQIDYILIETQSKQTTEVIVH